MFINEDKTTEDDSKRFYFAGFVDGGRGHEARNLSGLEAGKGKKRDSLLER